MRRLGVIQTQLAGLAFAAAPGFQINGLRLEELIALNPKILWFSRGVRSRWRVGALSPGGAMVFINTVVLV